MNLRSYIIDRISTTPKLAEMYTKRDDKDLPKRRFYFSIEKRCRKFIDGDVGSKTIIMPGLRGTGKTTALLQLYRFLTEKMKVSVERVLYLPMDEVSELIGSNLHEAFEVYIKDVLGMHPETLDNKVFLLVDEVHFDKNWQIAVKVLHDRSKNIFILVTGSSSIAIELTPDLVRRAAKEVVYPLNFSEYLIMKYDIYPPRNTARHIRDLIFEGKVNGISSLYDKIKMEISKKLPSTLSAEFRKYMRTGGFAFGIGLDERETFRRVWDIIEKIVRIDMPAIVNMKTENIPKVLRLISFIAIQKPGGVSIPELASKIDLSSATVSSFLDALEKTHLLFKVLPSNGAGVQVKKPWKYYFSTPSVNASIAGLIGKLESEDVLGNMLETLVASYLKRVIETQNLPYALFYDAKSGVDFILEHSLTGEKVPIEVTAGVKGKDLRRVHNAVARMKSKYGLVITGREDELKVDGEVIVLPAVFFSFL